MKILISFLVLSLFVFTGCFQKEAPAPEATTNDNTVTGEETAVTPETPAQETGEENTPTQAEEAPVEGANSDDALSQDESNSEATNSNETTSVETESDIIEEHEEELEELFRDILGEDAQ